jgi:hypothetical protein
MSNLSSNLTSNEALPSLDKLLEQLGFAEWEANLQAFVLAPLNLLGIVFCSFSLWIFTRPIFVDTIFFYYKLLCFVNIIHLLHNLPSCILFSPFYFPWSNTFAIALFQIYYSLVSFFFYQFEDVLHMGILLTRMKLFSTFVRKHFRASPPIVSLAFFLTCLLILSPRVFSFRVASFGDYFYYDSGGVKQTSTFYFLAASQFSQTLFGRVFLGFTTFFLGLVLSLLVGIVLNISSYIKFKSHARKKQRDVDELQMSSIHNRPTTSREMEQLRQRAKTESDIERNMLYMSLTLSSIVIVSRLIFMTGYVYFFIYSSFSNTIILYVILSSIYTIVPSISIFVFYAFNKMFRDETNRILKRV